MAATTLSKTGPSTAIEYSATVARASTPVRAEIACEVMYM